MTESSVSDTSFIHLGRATLSLEGKPMASLSKRIWSRTRLDEWCQDRYGCRSCVWLTGQTRGQHTGWFRQPNELHIFFVHLEETREHLIRLCNENAATVPGRPSRSRIAEAIFADIHPIDSVAARVLHDRD